MEQTKELIDSLYRDKVDAARSSSLEERILAGPRLFDFARKIMQAGIRMQFPEADDAEVERQMQRQFRIQDVLEKRP